MGLSVKQFLKNIKYLFKHPLDEIDLDVYKIVDDYYKCEVNNGNDCPLKIYDYEESLDLILSKPKSFCRFGDGEYELMMGRSIPFQEYDKELADKMKEVISNKCDDLYVGINYNYFHSIRKLNPFSQAFYRSNRIKYADFYLENCSKDKPYIAAGFNQLYMMYDNDYDFDAYYKKIKKMFEGRKVVLFCGATVFDNIQYDLFDVCEECIKIPCATKNSFRDYKEICEKCLSYSKDYTLCFIIGPTSKILVYELAKQGYLAWDIGHMAKDYDAYMKSTSKNPDDLISFYKPD